MSRIKRQSAQRQGRREGTENHIFQRTAPHKATHKRWMKGVGTMLQGQRF